MIGRALALLLVAVLLALSARTSHAQEAYSAADTLTAVQQASDATGVSYAWLRATVRCETGGTFDPYSIGRQGEEGAAQLHPRGLLPTFYAWGYDDPFDPYEAVLFMAQEFEAGQSFRWTCA